MIHQTHLHGSTISLAFPVPTPPPEPPVRLLESSLQQSRQSPGPGVERAVGPGVRQVTCSTACLTHMAPQVRAGYLSIRGPQLVTGVHLGALVVTLTEPTVTGWTDWNSLEDSAAWLHTIG